MSIEFWFTQATHCVSHIDQQSSSPAGLQSKDPARPTKDVSVNDIPLFTPRLYGLDYIGTHSLSTSSHFNIRCADNVIAGFICNR